MRCRPVILAFLALTLAPTVHAAPAPLPGPRFDAQGDPLPPRALARLGTVRLRQSHVRAVAFTPDGKGIISGGQDCTIRIWSALTKREVRRFVGHRHYVHCLDVSRDGKWLVSASEFGEVFLWDVASGKRLRTFDGHTYSVQTVVFSPDARLLASGCRGNTIRIWDVATGQQRQCLAGAAHQEVDALAFSPDGRRLAAGSTDHLVRLWDVATWRQTALLAGHTKRVLSLAFTPDGKELVTGGHDSTVRVWGLAGRKEKQRFTTEGRLFGKVALAPDGKTVATSAADGKIHLWDRTTGKEVGAWPASGAEGGALAYSPDGKTLAGHTLHSILLWGARTGERMDQTTGDTRAVTRLLYSPDGKTLAVGRDGGPISLYRVGRWGAPANREVTGKFTSFAFAPNSGVLATAEHKRVRLWNVATGKLQGSLTAQPGATWINSVAFSADGKLLAHDVGDQVVVWDVDGDRMIRRFGERANWAYQVAFVAAGGLAVGGIHEDANLWAPLTGTKLRRLGNRDGRIGLFAVSADGRALASATSPRPVPGQGWLPPSDIVIWEVLTGQPRCRLRGIAGLQLAALAWSPDGRLLASASAREPIRIWDLSRGEEVARLEGHEGDAWALAFSPDGRVLASGGCDTAVLLWDIAGLRREKAAPAPKLDEAAFAKRWEGLGEEDGAQVNRAMWALALAPQQAGHLLRQRLEKGPTDAVRSLRAIEVLERIGTPEARRGLQALAKSAAAGVKQEAEASLRRLGR